MRNLDQIRAMAAHSLCAGSHSTRSEGNFTRSDIAGFPSLVINNGLLAATAFAIEPGRETRAGLALALDGMARHLANPVHGIRVLENIQTAGDLLKELSSQNANSLDLQRATSEALAFFSYLKRFVSR